VSNLNLTPVLFEGWLQVVCCISAAKIALFFIQERSVGFVCQYGHITSGGISTTYLQNWTSCFFI